METTEPPKPVEAPEIPSHSTSLISLFRLLDHCYPDRLTPFFNEAAEIQSNANPVDSLAVSILTEVAGAFDPVQHHVDQVATTWDTIVGMKDLLERTADELRSNLVNWVLFDFLGWLYKSKRSQFTLSTFEAWIEIHPSDRVRQMKVHLVETLILKLGLGFENHSKVYNVEAFRLDEVMAHIWAGLHVA